MSNKSDKTLFDEINDIQNESHNKWCQRYFNRLKIEQRIKESAAKGYQSLNIPILSQREPYIKRRLDNPKTVEYLIDRLGTGFSVKNEKEYSKLKILGHSTIERHDLIISW